MNIKPIKQGKGTATDRQRFNNQMHYRPIDRCFNMEFGIGKKILNNGQFSKIMALPTMNKPIFFLILIQLKSLKAMYGCVLLLKKKSLKKQRPLK